MEKQVIDYFCDICGKRADGDFFMDMNVNDDYEDTYYCPLDLCKDCMRNFYSILGEDLYAYLYRHDDDEKWLLEIVEMTTDSPAKLKSISSAFDNVLKNLNK